MEGKIMKVMVELANGEVVEFNKQAVMFFEDDMTETEKKIHGKSTKMCSIANCNGQFMAEAASALLNIVRDNAPGLDSAIMLKHIESEEGESPLDMLKEMAKVFG